MTAQVNLYASETKVPSVSFKDSPIGTSVTGTVLEPPVLRQQSKFGDSSVLLFWDEAKTQKKMMVSVKLDVAGVERMLHAPKPGALLAAVDEAQTKAGKLLGVGDKIRVTLSGTKPSDKAGYDPQKLYTVDIKPSNAFAAEPAPEPEPVAAPIVTDEW